MGLLACKHPAKHLACVREQTVEAQDEEWERVTYHMFCITCGKDVDLSHVRTIHGVDEWLRRRLKK